MKTISVVIPTFNEQENIPIIYERIVKVFDGIDYHYELIFIDNCSSDRSRDQICLLCKKDSRVKAIFNAKNFGFTRSTFYGLTQAYGDAVVLLFADMQDPPELLLDFIAKYEAGSKIVVGIKIKSKENKLLYGVRKLYYRFIDTVSDIEHIRQFTGFGLYDQSFIEILRELEDPLPYLRGIVAELGFSRSEVYYSQEIRRYGKTSFNFMRLYDVAMLGITSYSKVILRLATMMGFILSVFSLLVALVYLILKLVFWDSFPAGMAPVLIGVFVIGSVQLFFIGLLGEYVLNINTKIMKRPLVIEEKRINFK